MGLDIFRYWGGGRGNFGPLAPEVFLKKNTEQKLFLRTQGRFWDRGEFLAEDFQVFFSLRISLVYLFFFWGLVGRCGPIPGCAGGGR